MESLPLGIMILPFLFMKHNNRLSLSVRSFKGTSVTADFSQTKNSIASTLESYIWYRVSMLLCIDAFFART